MARLDTGCCVYTLLLAVLTERKENRETHLFVEIETGCTYYNSGFIIILM